MVRVRQGAAACGPLAANHSDGLDVQMAKNPLALTLTHARTARTTLYAHNMHARLGYDVKLHPHRMLALMTSLLMGRKATTKQTNKQAVVMIRYLLYDYEISKRAILSHMYPWSDLVVNHPIRFLVAA